MSAGQAVRGGRMQASARASANAPAPADGSASLKGGTGLFQGGTKALCQPDSVIVSPEMHEEDVRLVVQHVVVHRRHFDPVFAQSPQHRIDFSRQEHEIAGNGGLSAPQGLEVDHVG